MISGVEILVMQILYKIVAVPSCFAKKIETAISSIDSPDLSAPYASQLHHFLDKRLDQTAEKILHIFTSNVLNVLQDVELPDSIKRLTVDKMPQMACILEKMFSNSSHLLLNSRRASSYPPYEAVSKELKTKLIEGKDPAGITFSARSLKLFGWTREEIEETANPLVGFLLQDPKIKGSNDLEAEVKGKLRTVFDISNLLVLQIACGDDIADNIQDEKLTTLFSEIPFQTSAQLVESRAAVDGHRRGIFRPYFDVAVTIWMDAVSQLETLFGKEYFEGSVKREFLEIHREVMGSLTYSQYMNSRPHDPTITPQTISDNLDPNIMVRCVRYLEKSLVIQIAQSQDIALPEAPDITMVDEIIRKSQKNAADSNAAATWPRERRENDLSSPFPFAITDQYNQTLLISSKTFIAEFEGFLKEEQYSNHFFATYFDGDPPSDFDYLSLLVLRREAFTQVIEQLERAKLRGLQIPETDYSVNSLAVCALSTAQESPDESMRLQGRSIGRLKHHIDLIDKFSDKLSIETGVQGQFFRSWEKEIETMKTDATRITNPLLKDQTVQYIQSWEVFLCMYLIFKRTLDGTI